MTIPFEKKADNKWCAMIGYEFLHKDIFYPITSHFWGPVLQALPHADLANLARLRRGFPELIEAWEYYKSGEMRADFIEGELYG